MCLQKSNWRVRSLTWDYRAVHRIFQVWSGQVWISDGGWGLGSGWGLVRDFFVLETGVLETGVLGSGFLVEFWLMICLARSTCLNILG